MDTMTELRLGEIAHDLAFLLRKTDGRADDVTYELHTEGDDLVAVATVAGQTRTFRLTVTEVDR